MQLNICSLAIHKIRQPSPVYDLFDACSYWGAGWGGGLRTPADSSLIELELLARLPAANG